MKKHLEKAELINTVFDEGKVRVCGVPIYEYESSYELVYTLDGKKFYCWSEDASYADAEYDTPHSEECKKRLKKLYKYISEKEMKKASEESWE